ncbi:MAG: 8-oxo-dGTP diphosphatase [Desulfobulbaceae bacterium]|nr:8-oxo-dGTP diphosphatase [Desulfobulbaceae bacterium]
MYEPIVGTLGYVVTPDRQKTLLVHRIGRSNDPHFGKYNGLGGKLRAEEDILSCMLREITEESGICCEEVTLRGTVNWAGFGPNGENWLGFIFLISKFSGIPYTRNEEGEIGWHEIKKIGTLPMWEGDQHFLPMVFDDDHRIFHGYMPYRNGRPEDWRYRRM